MIENNMKPISVTILPTQIWIESGIFGERYVVMQHQGMEPFDYAVFNYNYAYTSNSGTSHAATALALQLGAVEPIVQKSRGYNFDLKETDFSNQDKADMFWNRDDPERPNQSISSLLNDEICNGFLEVGSEFTIQRATSLSDIKIRVTKIDENECDVEYEVIEGEE